MKQSSATLHAPRHASKRGRVRVVPHRYPPFHRRQSVPSAVSLSEGESWRQYSRSASTRGGVACTLDLPCVHATRGPAVIRLRPLRSVTSRLWVAIWVALVRILTIFLEEKPRPERRSLSRLFLLNQERFVESRSTVESHALKPPLERPCYRDNPCLDFPASSRLESASVNQTGIRRLSYGRHCCPPTQQCRPLSFDPLFHCQAEIFAGQITSLVAIRADLAGRCLCHRLT